MSWPNQTRAPARGVVRGRAGRFQTGPGSRDGHWADDASETLNVALELVRRGYTEEEIGMLGSGNLLRALDDVQRVAAEIQAEGG